MATTAYGPGYTVVCITWFINVIQAKVRDKLEYKNNSISIQFESLTKSWGKQRELENLKTGNVQFQA